MSDGVIDLLCFGRTGIDLYGEQLGAPLRSMESLAMYVGGSAANTCVGTARLGLSTAMLTRVGDEDLGRFVLSTFQREGVATELVQLDGVRPTGVVALAVRERGGFPRVFLYADSPDLAVDPDLVDLERVRRARAVLLTGTMLSRPLLAELSRRLALEVRQAGGKVAFDADFRPVLWDLVPIGDGANMAARSPVVSQAYRSILPLCDLVVGTEEEIRAIAATDDLAEALELVRSDTAATVVVKAGARGATAYPGPGPIGEGIEFPGFSVETVNTVGAGDGFMSGFLSRWVREEPLGACLEAGNAGGALVASRHGCMSAMPVAAELTSFLARGGVLRPSEDEELERLHRLGTRRPTPLRLFVLAMDHRWQLEALVDELGVERRRLVGLKRLLADAFLAVAAGRDDCGILVDDTYGAGVLEQMAGGPHWTARPIDAAGSRPLELLTGEEVQAGLHSWPADQVVKVMCYTHPEDPAELTTLQFERLGRLARAARAAGRELLVELQTPAERKYGPGDLRALLTRLYGLGVAPEWWKLPAIAEAELWAEVGAVIEREDPSCRGVLVLGSTAARSELTASFSILAAAPCVRGFAIGRAIFTEPARAWLSGESSDIELVRSVADNYESTISAWSEAEAAARPGHGALPGSLQAR